MRTLAVVTLAVGMAFGGAAKAGDKIDLTKVDDPITRCELEHPETANECAEHILRDNPKAGMPMHQYHGAVAKARKAKPVAKTAIKAGGNRALGPWRIEVKTPAPATPTS